MNNLVSRIPNFGVVIGTSNVIGYSGFGEMRFVIMGHYKGKPQV
jgi:hypothetical protein